MIWLLILIRQLIDLLHKIQKYAIIRGKNSLCINKNQTCWGQSLCPFKGSSLHFEKRGVLFGNKVFSTQYINMWGCCFVLNQNFFAMVYLIVCQWRTFKRFMVRPFWLSVMRYMYRRSVGPIKEALTCKSGIKHFCNIYPPCWLTFRCLKYVNISSYIISLNEAKNTQFVIQMKETLVKRWKHFPYLHILITDCKRKILPAKFYYNDITDWPTSFVEKNNQLCF